MKNFELISFASAGELARVVASAWLDEIEADNRAGKPYCVALSGGRITLKFFAAVIEQAKARAVSFERVHFFWADERCVPLTDVESNFRAAHELLFTPLKIATAQIHRIQGELPPKAAAELAISEISNVAPKNSGSVPVLDLIFLGMGEDGHIASLFPGAAAEIVNCSAPFLMIENSPKPPPMRISLSYKAIVAARQVWVLASGAGKEGALHESLLPAGKTPLARVIQLRSGTKIFTDITPG
jgi:6-phosphogluconolactonase